MALGTIQIENVTIGSYQMDVKDSFIFYREIGEGDPIVFLHGVPTSSYLWRYVMADLSLHGRCLAPDLIGFGRSGKPDIQYSVFDHIEYIEAWLEQMDLENVTLVMHGWGSVVGFEVARRQSKRIAAMAFYESHVRPITDWNMLSLPVQELATYLNNRDRAYDYVMNKNYFVKTVLPSGAYEELASETLSEYEHAFARREDRKPIWQYILDRPLGDGPDQVVKLIEGYSEWLCMTAIPKLMYYAVPGFITTIDTVKWARNHLPNVWLADMNDAMHFAQESQPDLFALKFVEWRQFLA